MTEMNTPKLTIREGGFYRTRDGLKCEVVRDDGQVGEEMFWVRHPSSECDGTFGIWHFEDGRSNIGDADLDLIAEWSDAAPAPAEGTLLELDVKPGDLVEYTMTGRVTTVTRFDGSDYFGTGGNPDAPYSQTAVFRLVSRAPAADADDATIQRVMQASAPDVDLTSITTPFGLLPPETQAALKAHDGVVECFTRHGEWELCRWPAWLVETSYRAAPRPKVKTHAVDGVTYFTHDDKPEVFHGTITYTTTNGVIDPASYRVEARG